MSAFVQFLLLPFRILQYLFDTITHIPLNPSKCIIVITGCDSGFGLSTAQKLSTAGYVVVAACLTAEGTKGLKDKVALAIQCDVTNTKDIDKVVDATKEMAKRRGARLWAVVNNAGIAPVGFLDWYSMADCRRTMEVNFFAVVEIVKRFLPLLKQTKNSRIINVSSMAGVTGILNGSGYCASKHALEGLTKCIRAELLPWNIHVCNINPGFMKTPLVTGAKDAGLKSFRSAPSEITSLYPEHNLTKIFDFMVAVQESPKLVVNAIIHNVTVKRPHAFNPVGWQAFLISWLTYLVPEAVRASVEELANQVQKFGPYPHAVAAVQDDGGVLADSSTSKTE